MRDGPTQAALGATLCAAGLFANRIKPFNVTKGDSVGKMFQHKPGLAGKALGQLMTGALPSGRPSW